MRRRRRLIELLSYAQPVSLRRILLLVLPAFPCMRISFPMRLRDTCFSSAHTRKKGRAVCAFITLPVKIWDFKSLQKAFTKEEGSASCFPFPCMRSFAPHRVRCFPMRRRLSELFSLPLYGMLFIPSPHRINSIPYKGRENNSLSLLL